MREHFLQFVPQKVIPYDSTQKDYVLNPGNISINREALETPLGFSGNCTRFRFIVRGKWGPKQWGTDEKILSYVTKNKEDCLESAVTFRPNGIFNVVTRHMTTYPDVYFEQQDTIGISVLANDLSYHVEDYYVSAIVNFSHA